MKSIKKLNFFKQVSRLSAFMPHKYVTNLSIFEGLVQLTSVQSSRIYINLDHAAVNSFKYRYDSCIMIYPFDYCNHICMKEILIYDSFIDLLQMVFLTERKMRETKSQVEREVYARSLNANVNDYYVSRTANFSNLNFQHLI